MRPRSSGLTSLSGCGFCDPARLDRRSGRTLPGRLELPTLRLTASRSNQLSYGSQWDQRLFGRFRVSLVFFPGGVRCLARCLTNAVRRGAPEIESENHVARPSNHLLFLAVAPQTPTRVDGRATGKLPWVFSRLALCFKAKQQNASTFSCRRRVCLSLHGDTWPGSKWRPSVCWAAVVAARPQVPACGHPDSA